MPRLVWDQVGERFAEMGVDHGVVYPHGADAEAWNGLAAVNENASGAEATKIWADNINYITLRSAEQYGFTIEAYCYPDGFARCDGSAEVIKGVHVGQQARRGFDFSYRTQIVNDTSDEADDGYIIHLIWNATCSPTAKNHSTVNESPDLQTMSWECDTVPTVVESIDPVTSKPYKPFAHMEIDSRTTPSAKLTALEDLIYGTTSKKAELPSPDDVIALLTSNASSGGSSSSGSGTTTP